MSLTSFLSSALPFLVILAFALIIYAGFTKQKIADLIKQLIEKIKGAFGNE